MTIIVASPPNAEPISLAEAKAFVRAKDGTDEDALITSMIAAARQAAEQELGRALIAQTIEVYLDSFPGAGLGDWPPGADFDPRLGDPFEIRLPPVSDVTSIKYFDDAGVEQTLATDQYLVDVKSKPARIAPAYGLTWPSTRCQKNAVKITATAGYGADGAAVPACIKQWMFLRIKALYDNRDQFISGTVIAELPSSYVDGLLDPERVSAGL